MSSGECDQQIERWIVGALKAAINDHGPITKDLIPSVMKRFKGLASNRLETDESDSVEP